MLRERALAIAILTAIATGCATQPPAEEKPAAQAGTAPAAAAGPVGSRDASGQPTRSAPSTTTAAGARGIPAQRSVFYDYDKANIKNEFSALVRDHAGYLSGSRATRVVIEGNCDERGSREYNLALGQRRANSVANALKTLGATDAQLETVSWGKEKPKARGHDETAWSQNRRSDIVYK